MAVKKLLSGIVLTGTAGFLFVCAGIFFAPDFIDLNKYKQYAFDAVKNETGYEIKCESMRLKRSFSPCINLYLYHCVVLYPDGEIFLKLKESDVGIKLLPLLFKKFVINDVKLQRPIINIYLYKDFSTSLEKYSIKNKKINTKGYTFSGIDSGVVCNDYKVNIHDLSVNKDFFAQGEKLLLKEIIKSQKIRVITKGELISKEKKYIDFDLDIITDYERETPRFKFSPFKTLYENNVNAQIFSHLKTAKNDELFGNLNIKNLSLKVDNILMKDNNLSINFRGKELAFESLLHSSNADMVKSEGKLQYGVKKFADINVEAKNINIEAFCTLINKIGDILNVKNPISEVKIKGILDADFNVKTDFKKLQSKGEAALRNSTIKHKSLPYSVSDINAYADFNNNSVIIKNASAKVNNTPINADGTIKEDMSFNINVKSSLLDFVNVIKLFEADKKLPVNIIKGKLSFDASVKGILNKKYDADIKALVTGFSFIEKNMKIPVNIQKAEFLLKGDEKKYSGELLADSAEAVIEKQKIKADNLKAVFDEKKIVISDNQITYPSRLNYGGEISDYMSKPFGNLNFNGKIPSVVLASVIKNYVNIPYKSAGNISVSGKLNFKEDMTALKAKLNADENNYISYIVIKELFKKPSTLDIDCVASKNGISLNNVSLFQNAENKIISMSGKLFSGNNPEIKNLKIKIPGSVSGNSNFFGGENFSVKGDFTLNGKISQPEITGNLKILRFIVDKFAADVKNADVIFNGKSAKLIAPDVSVMNALLNVTADLKCDFKNITVENMQFNAKNFDVTSVYSGIKNYVNPKELSKFIVKKGSFAINNAKLLSLKANDIKGDFVFDKNTLYLTDITAFAYGGKLFGSAEFNLPTRFLKIKSKVKNLDIKTSVFDLCGFEDNLSGIADADVEISLYTGDGNIPLKTLSGYADFTSKNGKTGTLGKFEYYLYAKNIIRKGIMNATLNKLAGIISKEDTSNYRQAKGRVQFKSGYIYSDGIKTIGSKMSLFVTGKQNMLTGNSDINIYGRISDEIKSKFGSFADVSIAELFNSRTSGKKQELLLPVSDSVINEIPLLYNSPQAETSLFNSYISGNIKSVNSIKSFYWLMPVSSYNNPKNKTEIEEEVIEQKTDEIETQETEENEENKNLLLPDFSSL